MIPAACLSVFIEFDSRLYFSAASRIVVYKTGFKGVRRQLHHYLYNSAAMQTHQRNGRPTPPVVCAFAQKTVFCQVL
jgi:hypothetical protein